MSTPAPPTDTLTQAHLDRAEAILKDVDALSTELGNIASRNAAFYSVNRAWRAMVEAVNAIKESLL